MTATTTSQALAKRDDGPGALIEKYRGDFAMVLPSHIKPDHWVRLSQGVLRRDKKLAQVARQNPGSFLSALLDCARLGLEPGDTYHLVPFGNEITGIRDYTGEIELIYRAGAVSSVKAEIVYANDRFKYDPGTMDRPDHAPDWFGDRGEMIGVYAYGVMKDGAISRVVVMSRKDVERVKAVAKGTSRSDSPWKLWEDRMWLKTAVKQLAKWVPSSAEYREAVLRTEAAAVEVSERLHIPLVPEGVDPSTGEITADDDEIVDAELVDDETDEEVEVSDDALTGDGAAGTVPPAAPAAAAPSPVPPHPFDTPAEQTAWDATPPGAEAAASTSTAAEPMTEPQRKALHALLRSKYQAIGDRRMPVISRLLGRDVKSTTELSKADASRLIDLMQADEPEGGDQS